MLYKLLLAACLAALCLAQASGNHQYDSYQYPAPAASFEYSQRQPFSPPGYVLDDETERDDDMSFLQRLIRPWTWFSWLTERSDSGPAPFDRYQDGSGGGGGGQFDRYQELGGAATNQFDRYQELAAGGGVPFDTRYHHGVGGAPELPRLRPPQVARFEQQQLQQHRFSPQRPSPAGVAAAPLWQQHPAYKTARSDQQLPQLAAAAVGGETDQLSEEQGNVDT